MPRVFVAAHGFDPQGDDTFVPMGWKVFFYCDFDENAFMANQLAALVSGGGVGAVESYGVDPVAVDEPVAIPNYFLDNYDLGSDPMDPDPQNYIKEDRRLAVHLASQSSLTGGPLYFVGLPPSTPTAPNKLAFLEAGSKGLVLCGSVEECAEQGEHGPECGGLFGQLAEKETGVIDLHLLICRGSVDNAPFTVVLGSEPREDYDAQYRPRFRFPADDQRYFPVIENRAYEEFDQERDDVAGVMSDTSGQPQATRAALRIVGSHQTDAWADAQSRHWPLRRQDAPPELPPAVWGDHGDPPYDLIHAWKDVAWWHTFFYYLQGPADADGATKARLHLWTLARAYLSGTVTFENTKGNEYQTHVALDTEIAHVASAGNMRHPDDTIPDESHEYGAYVGYAGPGTISIVGDPNLPSDLIDELYAAIHVAARLSVVDGASTWAPLEPDQVEEVFHTGVEQALEAAQARVRTAVEAIYDFTYDDLQNHWHNLITLLYHRWETA